MTYGGGASLVIGQPPQAAWQYALPALINSSRATISPGCRRTCTLAGIASSTSVRRAFPVRHLSQYGFGINPPPVVAPPGDTVSKYGKAAVVESVFHCSGKRQKAGLQPRSPRPIGSFLKSACKRSQLLGRLSWLSSSFRLQANGRSLVFVGNDPVPVGKIDPDHAAQNTHSKSLSGLEASH